MINFTNLFLIFREKCKKSDLADSKTAENEDETIEFDDRETDEDHSEDDESMRIKSLSEISDDDMDDGDNAQSEITVFKCGVL